MKTFCLTILLGILCCTTLAQDTRTKFPVSISYVGNYLLKPGVQIATQVNLSSWENKSGQKDRLLYLSPQIAYFTDPGNHYTVFVQPELGLRFQKKKKATYTSLGLMAGYHFESTLLSFSINQEGERINKERAWATYLVPGLSFERGKAINNKLEAFGKVSLGQRFSQQASNSQVLFVGLGLRFL